MRFLLFASIFSMTALSSSFVSAERFSDGYHLVREPAMYLQVKETLHNAERFEAQSSDFIDELAKDAIGFISDTSLNNDQKRAKFKTLLNSKFDLRTIARFALGRYYRQATEEQKKEYYDLFEDMVVGVYSSRFSEYSNEKLEVLSSRYDGRKDALVTSAIIPKSGPKVNVEWRVRLKDGKYRVVDVMVEGVSMSVTQRSEFSSIISRGGGQVSALITHLKSQ